VCDPERWVASKRRSEIGWRRALGATRAHIRIQFVGESVLLAGLGGIGGAVLGGAVTARLRRHT
jgi:putative ABC transport system permease protein